MFALYLILTVIGLLYVHFDMKGHGIGVDSARQSFIVLSFIPVLHIFFVVLWFLLIKDKIEGHR